MQVDDFDISSSKIGETAVRQIDRAVEEARRRDHGQLSNEHLFLAFLQVEWDLFADVMHDVGLNPHVILEATEEHLRRVPPLCMPRFRVSPPTKLILKLALNRAMRCRKTGPRGRGYRHGGARRDAAGRGGIDPLAPRRQSV